ncbi:MAG TPA: tripartite tricarboxylate transporter substrate binding protein [Burkholderiales bacterium]|nr:tripartite tricarboxylate transporter substrate binding protein [Burkholderiales bacterium]
MIRKTFVACVAASSVWAGPAFAQAYPAKAIRMIVHFPAGGPTDLVARAVGQKLNEAWGQPVIIENRPGAGGIVGVETVVRAAPDGYTLLFATGGSMSITPAIGTKTSYDVFKDLTPISLVVINPQLLVLHPSLPASSVKELIKFAKAKPGQINYASVGPGSPQHLGIEMLKHMTGIDMVHIPYKGTAPAMTDVLAGHVSLMFNSMPSVLQYAKTGRLKGIAVSTARRSAAAPEIPTVAESGVPGFQYATWYGVLGPAALPKDITTKLNAEIVRILKDKELAQRLAREGAEPAPGTPEELAKYMRSEYDQWRKTIAAAKLKID